MTTATEDKAKAEKIDLAESLIEISTRLVKLEKIQAVQIAHTLALQEVVEDILKYGDKALDKSERVRELWTHQGIFK